MVDVMALMDVTQTYTTPNVEDLRVLHMRSYHPEYEPQCAQGTGMPCHDAVHRRC